MLRVRGFLGALFLLASCGKGTSLPCDSCGGACTQDFIPAGTARHVDNATYDDNPPTGGDHNACWSSWGVHDTPVDTDRWVHNLEHGGVVFLYDCPNGCDAEVASLTTLVNSLPTGRALLTATTGMPTTFAAVSWEHRILLGCLDLSTLRAFFDNNLANAPEDLTANPPADCPP